MSGKKLTVTTPVIVGAFAAVFGVFVGASGYTFHYGEGLSYFSKEPSACVNCHIMQPQYDAWQKASHHGVATCVDCHLPHSFFAKWVAKAENGFWHSKGFTLQDFHEPIFLREKNKRILHESCLVCHGNLVNDILMEEHENSEGTNCIHCHRDVGHGESAGLGKYIEYEFQGGEDGR